MKASYTLLFSLTFSIVSIAQVNRIKQKSSDNSNDRSINRSYSPPSNNNSNSNRSHSPPSNNRSYSSPPSNNNRRSYDSPSSSSSGSSSESYNYGNVAADSSCIYCCNDLSSCLSSVESNFNAYQKKLVRSAPVNPHILAFEAFLIFSQNMNYFSQLIQPKFRATWGFLGTEYRFSSLVEPGSGSYNTHDWQLLQLNLVSRREFWMRLGGGFMFEEFSQIYFQEYSLQNEVKFERKLTGNFDFRFSYDDITKTYARVEAGTRLHYAFYQDQSTSLKLLFGMQYQSYFQTVNLYQLQTGIMVMFY